MAQTIKLKRSGTSGRLPTTSDLELGEVAINTYDGKMYIKKNVGGTESIVEIGGQGGGIASSFTLYEYTATSGQTTFSGSDGNSNTLAYDTGTPPKILVYLNGVLLDHTTDYTATNGTSVVLTNGAATNDLLQIAAYKSSVSTTLDIDLSDTQKLLLGDDDDLQIYHDGNHSYIRDSGTGRLYITSNNLRVTNAQGDETLLDAYENGRVDLYYDNSKKFETTSTGVDVTGGLVADSGQIDGTFIVDGGTGVSSSGVLHVRQSGDGDGNGIALTSSNATSHRIWKDSSGVLNIGSSSNSDAFQQDTTGNATFTNNVTISQNLTVDTNTLYVDSTNNDVGIGTASPEDKLHISGGNLLLNNALEVRTKDTGGNLRTVLRANSSNELEYGWSANAPVKFMGGGSYTERMRIHTNGNIGINETSPAGSLHISNAAQASLVLQGDTANSGDSGEIDAAIYMLMDKGAGNDPFGGTTHGAHGFRLSTENHSGASAFRIDDWDNGSYLSRMYINTSGDVGIGTTSPNSYSNQKVLTINGTTHSRIDFETADTLRGSIYGDTGSLNLDAGGNYLRFYTGNTQKMTLLANGNLGVGVTSPQYKLDVAGTGHFKVGSSAALFQEYANGMALWLDGSDGDFVGGDYFGIHAYGTTSLDFSYGAATKFSLANNGDASFEGSVTVKDGTTEFEISGDSSGNTYLASNGEIRVRPSGTTINKLVIGSNGNITTAGTISSGNITTSGYLAGPATFTIDPAAVGDNTGTVVIAGNLQVDGTTTTINSTTLTVDDKNITLASGSSNAAAANGAGITVDCGSGTDATLTYNGTLDTWEFNKRVDVTSEVRLFRSDGARSGSLLHNTSGTVLRTNSNGDNLYLQTSGTGNVYLQPSTAGYSTVVNEDGIDSDFRVESDGNTHAFFVDAGNSRLGINTSSLTADGLTIGTTNSNCELDLHNTGTNGTRWRFNSTGTGHLYIQNKTESTTALTILDPSGYVGIGTDSPNEMLQINSADSAIRVNTTNAANNSELQLLYNNNTSHGIILRYHGNSALGYIDNTYPRTQGQSYGDILFRQNYAGTMTEHMRLTAYDGFLGIGTNIPKAKLQVEVAGIDTTTTSTTATTQVAIDTFAAATFRSARYTIQVTNSTDSTYHLTEVLLIHDGTTPQITEYGTIFTGSAEATFDADISSGNVRLLATPATTDSMTFKVVRHCITV